MILTTSKEFRENQASFLNLADQGEQVIIRRRGKQSYLLVPIEEDDDIILSPTAEEKKRNAIETCKRTSELNLSNQIR